MTVQTFGDRFTYANPALVPLLPSLDTLSDQQLAAVSPALATMGAMVRRHSILLRSVKLSEIYRVITEQSDPRIGLRLAAAKNAQGVNVFPNIDAVKAAMFGPASPTDTNFVDENLNVFVDGIRRVSVALAASWLVGQYAQIEEQRRHGELMEKQALADLDFLIKTYEETETTAVRAEPAQNQAFYFEDVELTLQVPLVVDLYMPRSVSTAWVNVGNYSGVIKTATLVADICDTVNNLTLNNAQGNILASPVLAAGSGLHRIDVQARVRDMVVSFDLISLRIRLQGSPTAELPFRWGVSPSSLRPETLNSTLVQVEKGTVQTLNTPTSARQVERSPTVLYFRRGPLNGSGQPLDAFGNVIPTPQWAMANLTFRISPTMNADETVVINRIIDPLRQDEVDAQRYSQVALELLNRLFTLKPSSVWALGALIRNDDPQQTEAMAALELVAYTLNQVETWMILDVLELPPDIQMATGDLLGPITSFSNKPRSIRVQAKFVRHTGVAPLPPVSPATPSISVATMPDSVLLQNLKVRLARMEGRDG